jgi:acyl carrier protein
MAEMTKQVEEPIRQFIHKAFPLSRKNSFQDGEKWLETGILDSLGVLDLIHFLEERFSFQISDDELVPENFDSFAAVVSYVQYRTANQLQREGRPCK